MGAVWNSTIERRTPLERGTGPTRKTRMAKRNQKRQGSRFPKQRTMPLLRWQRRLPCTLAGLPGHRCRGVVEVAHLTPKGRGAPDAGNVVPLCRAAHRRQEGHETLDGLDLRPSAERLTALWRAGVTVAEVAAACEDAGMPLVVWLGTRVAETLSERGW